jgi:hypothetical protein
LFLIVTVLIEDVAPRFTVPKLTGAGLAEITGGLQFSESLTATYGFLGSFEEIGVKKMIVIAGYAREGEAVCCAEV